MNRPTPQPSQGEGWPAPPGGWPAAPSPAGGWPPPPGGWPAPSGPGGGRKVKQRWWIAAGVAAVLVVGVVVATALSGRLARVSGTDPGGTVRSYLEALARGDAKAALSLSDYQPTSSEFLTDEVLGKQIAQWPITNIEILGQDEDSPGKAQVRVAAEFGPQRSTATLRLKKNGGGWRLDTATAKFKSFWRSIDPGAPRTLTLFGKPAAEGTFYVFPGWLDLGSTNPYLAVKTKPRLLEGLTGADTGAQMSTFELNDAGRNAIDTAVAGRFADCQKSTEPPWCQKVVRDIPAGTPLVWGQPDLSTLRHDLDPATLTVSVAGDVTLPMQAKTADGELKPWEAGFFMSWTADLNTTPLTLSVKY